MGSGSCSLPLVTGANIASEPSSRKTCSVPSPETSTRTTSGAARFSWMAGLAVSMNGSTRYLDRFARGELRVRVQPLEQRRRCMESFGKALEERLVAEPRQLRLLDQILRNRPGERARRVLVRDRIVGEDRLSAERLARRAVGRTGYWKSLHLLERAQCARGVCAGPAVNLAGRKAGAIQEHLEDDQVLAAVAGVLLRRGAQQSCGQKSHHQHEHRNCRTRALRLRSGRAADAIARVSDKLQMTLGGCRGEPHQTNPRKTSERTRTAGKAPEKGRAAGQREGPAVAEPAAGRRRGPDIAGIVPGPQPSPWADEEGEEPSNRGPLGPPRAYVGPSSFKSRNAPISLQSDNPLAAAASRTRPAAAASWAATPTDR